MTLHVTRAEIKSSTLLVTSGHSCSEKQKICWNNNPSTQHFVFGKTLCIKAWKDHWLVISGYLLLLLLALFVTGKKAEHEASCSFGTSACPNSAEHCGKFRQRDLHQHLKVCPYTPCHNVDKGKTPAHSPFCVLFSHLLWTCHIYLLDKVLSQ